jgi:amidase
MTATARDRVEEHLAAIERLNGPLNAIVTLDAEGARRRADELDREPEPVGPLHGVPMTIKDAFATAGMRTTSGMVDRRHHVPHADAPAVARLRAAGAVVLGKTNVPAEIAGQETANELFGVTRNPWDLDRTPGGSSGGAAVAVATGMAALELGSDSGGSVRQPAHCCGVFGHVPTHGLLPIAGHLPSAPLGGVRHPDLTDTGPLAASATDLAVALPVVAGGDLPAARPVDRVGVWCERVSSGVGAAIEAVGGDPVDPPFDLAHAEMVAFLLWVADTGELALSPDDRRSLEAERGLLVAAWHRLLDRYDVVLCPISPVVAVEHDPEPALVHTLDRRLARTIDVDGDARPYLEQITWNVVVGLAGLPATAAPVGPSGGLPVGLQVVGRPHDDLTTIAVAGEVGRYTPPPTTAASAVMAPS